MRKLLTSVIAAAVVVAPARAAGWHDSTVDVQPGTFVGARLKLPLGERTTAKPRAELAIAPTQSRLRSSGRLVRTRIGEGVALGVAPGAKPTLTLAGIPANRALGLNRSVQVHSKNKMGLSTGAWVGIGVVAAIGVGVLLLADFCHDKNSLICGDDE